MNRGLLTLIALIAGWCIAVADETLDPNYVYTEPTVVTNCVEIGSNLTNYSFICNNVQVNVTKGARYADYFGVNAGESVTFTTTQPMKAIVVNGFIKKDFDATASVGEIVYADASEAEVTAEQVLAVTNINATTLTINCVKQLRCYSVSIYFSSIPEISIEEEEDDYSFEWEPEEATTINLTFTDLDVLDMTENLGYACTSLYLSNDDYEMSLSVFTSTIEGETILPVGTYPINDSYEDNTVMASPGGYEDYDFPSYLITGFEYNEASNSWSYNTVYYLASGTMEVIGMEGGVQLEIHATTHFGSTVNATYIHSAGEAVEIVTTDSQTSKSLRNGQLLLQRGEATYTILGTEL